MGTAREKRAVAHPAAQSSRDLQKFQRPFRAAKQGQDASVDKEMSDERADDFALLPSAHTQRGQAML
ncbi:MULTISPECIES: hypothetical protein [unclassified Bradyrhizobium]|uniref:hypothetical protein n=1 Tax=unclassified Bradyrhizobium TaxID=2631580 RepID=UPI0023055BA9|nr:MULTISPECIES: hypothetical protein [unclassified Bradyrhizobium]